MKPIPFLQKKSIAIWGFGYLGYTAALKAQQKGFKVYLYDPDPKRFEAFDKNLYPSSSQKSHWSVCGTVPELNREALVLCSTPDQLFSASNVHLVATPILDKGKAKGQDLEKLARIVIEQANDDALFIFQSVGRPGQIEESFLSRLQEAGCRCSVAVGFRSDWVWEEYQNDRNLQVIAANDADSLQTARQFYDWLCVRTTSLSSIKEAEVYENSKNAITYTTTALINQLSLAYPDVNFQKISRLVMDQVDLTGCALSIGAGGYRMPFSVDALMEGSDLRECMSILKEAESVNFSTILSYRDYLARRQFKSVLIMGIVNRENKKDQIAISPSLTLAEALSDRGIAVYINDPHFSSHELTSLVPFCQPVSLNALPAELEAVVVMSAHPEYRFLSQESLDEILHPNIQLIIDNTGTFSGYRFEHAEYHRIGDGRINLFQ